MAVRIYALAKELKLDSKVLVDLCTKAGVTGKGSALASLTDDEVETVKAFIGGRAAPAVASVPAPVQRQAVASGSATATLAPPSAPVATKAPPLTPGAFRREDYMPPAGGSGRPLVIPSPAKPEKPAGEQKKSPGEVKPPSRTGPAIKLAPLPAVQQPPAAKKPEEPAPQKPDIKLPMDAIRASKAGKTPLSEHLRKHEEKRRKESGRPPGTKSPAAPAMPQPLPGAAGGRDRPRKSSVAAVAEEEGAGAKKGALGGREQRQLKRRRGGDGRKRSQDEDGTPYRSAPQRFRRLGTNTAAPRKTNVVVELPCTVRSFSEAIGIPAQKVLGKLLALGMMMNINALISREQAELLAVELGVEVKFKRTQSLEDQFISADEDAEDAPESLEPRAPVVTFLGHVDHGKTSLLDKIIGIDVASGESGGITQHIRAYRVEKDGRAIAFVDTPGHEAFTEMRARGANVTDIAVLVVAADDGVMPQTEEAISHARAAGVPIVVALNKIDLYGIDVNRIMQQLATAELLPTEWGGETEVVRCSALTGEGIDQLLETLLLMAELRDYRANPNRAAHGTCLEAELHEGRGVVAKLLVQKGTLKVGDVIVCGSSFGRVKAMYDTLWPRVTYQEAPPSTPVNVTGLDVAPGAGEHFHVLEDITKARQIAEGRADQDRKTTLGGAPKHVTLENLHERLGQNETQTLNMILRADVRGSIEAIQKELTKLEHPEVQLRILQATVGGITEADVHLADASDAIIIGFNVVPDEGARALSEQRGVQIRRYDIIYQVTADLKLALEGMLKPEQRQVDLGRALVQRTFTISRMGTIAGCRVLSGNIERNTRIRVIRENRIIGDYSMESLRREKDDVREVREGMECGIKLSGFNDLKEGDVLECYKTEQVARTL